MSILNVENLTHGFGDRMLLQDISFRLLKGEHVGLVGDNGTGKTTFLKLLTGRLLPDAGAIQWSPSVQYGHLDQHMEFTPEMSIMDALRTAFSHLYLHEKRMMEIAARLESQPDGREAPGLLKTLGELQEVLESSGFYSIDSLIGNVAGGLGLDALGLDTPIGHLSGGQRTKVRLARLLLTGPDVLLLDEPTNYLDKEHIEWLAGFLHGYSGSFILISHDTGFLNRVTNVIYHIEFTRMTRYPGNYEKFLQLREQNHREYLLKYSRQQEEIARTEEFIRKNIARASTTRRAQSRQKQLDKIQRMEKPRNSAKPSFFFTPARESSRLVYRCSGLKIGYDEVLLPPLDIKLEKDERIAVTGFNGIGKSTLLKTVLNLIPSLGGTMEYGDYLFPAYFEQEAKPDGSHTALEEIWHEYPGMSRKEVCQALARCGLKQEHVTRRMAELSGGEQTKVRLCKLMLKPSNWLILDEPTNHLDTAAKEALRDSLKAYKGTILLVSHEKDFYADWITRILDMENLLDRITLPV